MNDERKAGGIEAAAWTCAALAGAVRWPLFWTAASTPSADEAVFGLMAMKILRGEDLPAFCWGAHYAGALVSYLAALLFALLGVGPHVLRAATLPFALGAPAAAALLAGRWAGRGAAWTAGLLLAVPPPVFALYSVSVLGGHAETYLFGPLVLLLADRLAAADAAGRPTRGAAVLLGLVAGVGTWTLVAVVPFAVAAAVPLWRRGALRRREGPAIGLAFLAGLSPAIGHNIVHPLATLRRGAGRALGAPAFDRAHLIDAPVEFLGGGAVAFVLLAALVAVLVVAIRRRPALGVLLAGQVLLLAAMGLGRPRHVAPLYVTATLAVAAGVAGRTRAALAGVLLLANTGHLVPLYGTRGPDFGPLVAALDASGARYLAADYNVAYPVTFLTRERIVAAPLVGDTTDRWPPYTERVRRAAARGETVVVAWSLGDSVVVGWRP